MNEKLEVVLLKVHRVLESAGVPHAVIGGLARNVHAHVRTTKDVDFAILVDSDEQYRSLIQTFEAQGFSFRQAIQHDEEDNYPDMAFFQHESGVRCDLLIAKMPFEFEALREAIVVEREGAKLPIVSIEHLIVYKVIAGRTRDLEDIRAIIATQRRFGKQIDWNLIERYAEKWEVGERLARVRKESEQR